MAYITADRTKEIKRELQQAFPGLRFSVRNRHYTEVAVTITQGDVDFSDIIEGEGHKYIQLNHFYLDRYGRHSELLTDIYGIINKGNYDRSDSMTDYFDVGFYIHMQIGEWDKPYIYKAS
jgi:hypothetical protein